jgi:predicted nucleic acid-binding protein
MRFVLDNSITMRWLFKNGRKQDLDYAFRLLAAMETSQALVPNLWHLEVVNVLVSAEEDGLLAEAESQTFLEHLRQMPIVTDPATAKAAFDNTVHLARRYRLSAYDAAYLELAIREEVALATLDGELRKAVTKAGVQLFQH